VDYLSKDLDVDDRAVMLQVWDTAGQERFQGLGTNFYRGSDGVVFVFDVTRRDTFDSLNTWRESFLIQIGEESNKNFPMIIIGNKVDRSDRVVTTEMANEFCNKHGVGYIECSAKESTNVEKAFEMIAKNVISKMNPEDFTFEETGNLLDEPKKKDGDCC